MGDGESSQQIVLGDIFGQIGNHQVEGLLDSESEEKFDKGYCIIAKKWKSTDSDESRSMHALVTYVVLPAQNFTYKEVNAEVNTM